MGAPGTEGREEERRVEAEVLGTEDEEPLFLPTPSFMVSAEEEWGTGLSSVFPLCCSFVTAFVISLVSSQSSRDRPRREATGKLVTRRHRADSGGDKDRTKNFVVI